MLQVITMLKRIFCILTVLSAYTTSAQQADSIFVVPDHKGWTINHLVKNGENVFTLSRRYHVPPAILSDANHVSYQQVLKPGTRFQIPVGAYNLLTSKPQTQDARPLYFRSTGEESLYSIARNTGVTQKTIQQWNNLYDTEIRKGQTMLVGWLLFDNTNIVEKSKPPVANNSNIKIETHDPLDRRRVQTDTIFIPMKDTLTHVDTLSEGEALFLSQTGNGTIIVEDKGTAAFFKRAGRSENGIYFAFHNTARRGTIIKIFNPGTGKTVYAKVLGKIPVREIFHNAILGISSDAKAELGTGAQKMWCEISYAP